MKILFVASVYRHITAFHIPYIKYFQSKGYEVWVAGTGKEDRATLEQLQIICVDIPFSRSPLSLHNIKAYKEIKRLIYGEKFDLIHVHTPVAALLTRAAFRKNKHGKLVYTAHGFHFFEGAPKLNWFIYYPAEKLAAKWTDHLITINEEDYKNAQKLLPKGKISLVHGVGVENAQQCLTDKEKQNLRETLDLDSDAITIAYIAELNENKNHQFLLRNWKTIKANTPQFELLIIGTGDRERQLKEFVDNEQLEGIHFLGYRRDVSTLLQISDVVALLSYREGLPKSIMEAMVESIPCIVTNTRGLRDLVKSNDSGFVVNHGADTDLVVAFNALSEKSLREKMGERSKKLIEPYLLDNVIEEYTTIYSQLVK